MGEAWEGARRLLRRVAGAGWLSGKALGTAATVAWRGRVRVADGVGGAAAGWEGVEGWPWPLAAVAAGRRVTVWSGCSWLNAACRRSAPTSVGTALMVVATSRTCAVRAWLGSWLRANSGWLGAGVARDGDVVGNGPSTIWVSGLGGWTWGPAAGCRIR